MVPVFSGSSCLNIPGGEEKQVSPRASCSDGHVIAFPSGSRATESPTPPSLPSFPRREEGFHPQLDRPPAWKAGCFHAREPTRAFPGRPLTEERFQANQAADEVIEVDDEVVVGEAGHDDLVELAGQLETCGEGRADAGSGGTAPRPLNTEPTWPLQWPLRWLLSPGCSRGGRLGLAEPGPSTIISRLFPCTLPGSSLPNREDLSCLFPFPRSHRPRE